jgi:hypothetical protein
MAELELRTGEGSNVDLLFEGRWTGLAMIGVTTSSDWEWQKRYRTAADEAKRLFLAAPALLVAMENISTMANMKDASAAADAAIAAATT